MPFGKRALAGQRRGDRQAVFFRYPQQQRGILRIVHPVAHQAGDVETAQEVVSIMLNQDVSLIAAWRIFRGLSQYDVAEKLGTTQSAVSQWEAPHSKPQKKTREKLAALYRCQPAQMTL